MNPLKVIKNKKMKGNVALVYLHLCLRVEKIYDKERNVYCIAYPLKDLCADLSLSLNTATKTIKKLQRIGLLKVERVGGGKPNLLYIRNVDDTGGENYGSI